ncbi:MAG: hypothetical protein RLZZ126_1491 [Pseudomonadota bacterium]|jgi:hypothetical protein
MNSSINSVQFLYPIAAMALLVAVVTVRMLMERIGEMKARRIHPQKFASSTQLSAALEHTRGADNYKNLFEMPVLFYVLCLVLFTLQSTSTWLLAGAWLYVALRYLHSYIHLGYNKVMHRFKVFGLSVVVLSALWLGLTVQLLMRS